MSRRGRVDLTESDIAGLAAGTITMSEIAARCGVSRSAISDHCKKRGIKHSLRPGVGVRAKRDEGERLLAAMNAIEDPDQRQRIILNFRAATLINMLDEASRIAAAGGLAPKSLRDLAGAVAELEDRMISIGLIPGDADNSGKLTTLNIQVMSHDEAANVRKTVEADHAENFGEVQNEPTGSNMPDNVIDLDSVRQHLGSVELRHGQAGLRALAVKLGVADTLPRHDPDKVKSIILRHVSEAPVLAEKIFAA